MYLRYELQRCLHVSTTLKKYQLYEILTLKNAASFKGKTFIRTIQKDSCVMCCTFAYVWYNLNQTR